MFIDSKIKNKYKLRKKKLFKRKKKYSKERRKEKYHLDFCRHRLVAIVLSRIVNGYIKHFKVHNFLKAKAAE